MGSLLSSQQTSSETAVARYDQRAAAQASDCHESDFTSPKCLVDHLKPGDLIQKKGEKIAEWFYSHWAVYIGNGDIVHVTDVAGSSAKSDIVKEDMVAAFKGSRVRKNNHMDDHFQPMRTHDIIFRARRAVGTPWNYNIFTKNCEHFASWCRYNKEISLQSHGMTDVKIGRVSVGDYIYYLTKPVSEKCATFFKWVKDKVAPRFAYVTESLAIAW